MPLVTKTSIIDATIRAATERLYGHLAICAALMNQVASILLEQDDIDLTNWLNAKGEDLQTVMDWHASTGQRINKIIECTNEIMQEAGLPICAARVDVSPFAEKLSANNRILTYGETGFNVTSLPTQATDDQTDQAAN